MDKLQLKKTWNRCYGFLGTICLLTLLSLPLVAQIGSSQDSGGIFSQGNGGQSNQQPVSTNAPQQPSQDVTGPHILSQSQQEDLRTNLQQQNGYQRDLNDRYRNTNPLEPVALTPFQRLVAASVGRVLPLYGADLFTNAPSTFAPVEHIPVTPEYVIGPGDEILLRVWGQIVLDGHFTVDRTGNIYIPQVGTVSVAGIPFARLTDYLRSQIAHTFRNFDLNVNIGQLRSIQIFVVGQARHPGSYTISSLSTLVNALFASGGPSPMGSMRSIQVRRGGHVVTDFDLYDLLLRGDKTKDVPLESGDVIFIPPVGSMVAVAGSVDQPALYELKSESTVQDVLALAGGLSTLAEKNQVHIERIAPHDTRSILDVKLDESGLHTPLKDGDLLEVTPVIDRFKNAVTLRGNVADPRRFAWFPGMHISDLIPDKDALLTRDYWERRNRLGLPVLDSTPDVRRYAPDQPVAQINGMGINPIKSSALLNTANVHDNDKNVYGRPGRLSIDDGSTYQSAASNNTNSQQYGTVNQNLHNSDLSDALNGQNVQGMQDMNETGAGNANAEQSDQNLQGQRNSLNAPTDTRNTSSNSSASGSSISTVVTNASRRFPVKNTVVLSAPEVDWQYAVIQRLDQHDLTTKLIPFNLGRVVLEHDAKENLELEPGDVVTIFSKADLKVPQAQQTKYVRLEGEFKSSGIYSVTPGETLRQLVARVGLTSDAYLYGSQFTRESTRALQQQRLNDYAAELDRRIRLAEANAANNTLNPQDQIADIASLQNARTVSLRLRQLSASGRIVLDIPPNAKTVADIPDIPLEDGDTFIVPQVPSTVDVFGSVYTQTSFLYNRRMRAGDYIRQAGGGTRTADVKRAYIVRADGSVISRQFSNSLFAGNFDGTHLYPGDAVVIPEAVDRRPFLRNLVDVATIVGQFGLGIAAINVLK